MKARIGKRKVEIKGKVKGESPELYGWPKRKDKWNYAYAQCLDAQKSAKVILDWWYEPHAWRIAEGISHKADFLVWLTDSWGEPRLEIHEVKGWSRNLRDGITRHKIARDRYPCFVWRMFKKEQGAFVEVEV